MMRQTRRILLLLFWVIWAFVGLIVLAFEFDFLHEGWLVGKTVLEYFLSVVFELATLIIIPLALSMFKWKWIKNDISSRKEKAMLFWSITRIAILAVPMLASLAMYYNFMSPTFCYLAIVLGLCLFMVYPSYYRCAKDIQSIHDSSKP